MRQITFVLILTLLGPALSTVLGADTSGLQKQIDRLNQRLAKAQLEISDLKKRIAVLEISKNKPTPNVNQPISSGPDASIIKNPSSVKGPLGLQTIAAMIPTTYLPKPGVKDWDPIKEALFRKQIANDVLPKLKDKIIVIDVELYDKSLSNKLNLSFRSTYYESKSMVFMLNRRRGTSVAIDAKYAERFIKPPKKFKLSLVIENVSVTWRSTTGRYLNRTISASTRQKPLLMIEVEYKDAKLIGFE